MRTIKKGATSQSLYFEVLDSTSTTGGRKTGLVFNTASLTAYYVRNGGSATSITLATLAAANSAWSSGGFKEVDATNMPGLYRLDVPDAAFASGAESVAVTIKGASGMVQASYDVQLVDNMASDVYSRIGAPVGASISADIAGVQADTDNIQTRLPTSLVSGRIDASVGAMASGVLTATAIAADAITDAKVASDVTIASVTGSVGSVTGNVGGNVAGSVGSIATGGITSGSFAAGAIDNAAIATDAIGSAELAASAVTEIQSGLSTLDAAGVRSAVGLASANLDTQLDALPTTAEVNAEVDTALSDAGVTSVRMAHLDADVSSRLASGSYTAPPSAATIAQAVWDALTSALTTVGSVGKLLVTNVDAAITSRLASGSYTAPDNASITSIKAKTDNLPSDPADQSLIIAATDAIKGDTAAIKTKTDQLAFTGGNVDANIEAVNGTAVTGTGTVGDPWGPA